MPASRFAIAVLGAMLFAVLVALPLRTASGLSAYFYATQDLTSLLAAALVMSAAALLAPRLALAPEGFGRLGRTPWASVAAAAGLAAAAFLGTRWVFQGTPVSYDEVQANFDAQVFLGGSLAAPVPPEWRAYADALVPTFLREIPGQPAWVSSYWPVHAGLRALADLLVGMDWTSPLLGFAAVVATYHAARTLWPERPDAAFVAVILLATSPQVLVTAMTPYAMTAHLALNMAWLALFLRDRPGAHGAAILVGVLAVGLHQVVFHAIFVAPFLAMLALQRRWRLATVYGSAYAVIGLAWIAYPTLLAAALAPATASDELASSFFLASWGQADALLTGHDQILALAWINLSRLVAWLNPALVVLFAIGLRVLPGRRPVEIAMASGVFLTLAAMILILPYQGHGWGYRYLHGLIGCMALVAAIAWMRLTEPGGPWAGIVAGASALTLVVLLPLNAFHARAWTAPIRQALDLIESQPVDLVFVDRFLLSSDLVRNRPDLSNRPISLALSRLDPAAVEALCAGRKVAVLDRRTAARLGMVGTQGPGPSEPSPQRAALDRACAPKQL